MNPLLRKISKVRLSFEDIEALNVFLSDKSDPEILFMSAEQEGVSELLYYHLRALEKLTFFPEKTLIRMEALYRLTTQRNMAIMNRVFELSESFEGSAIHVIALQGLSVIRLYENPGLRPMRDVDFMVHYREMDSVKEILKRHGFLQNRLYPDTFCKEGLLIDLHTHLLNIDRIGTRRHLFPEDISGMWSNAVPFYEGRSGLYLLDVFDNFIALSAHALKHSYSRFIWMVDLHEILLTYGHRRGFWREMAVRTKFWKQESVVLYTLILLEKAFDFKPPHSVLSELGFERLSHIEKKLIDLKVSGFSSNELCMVLWLCNIKGLGNKFRFFYESVFPRTEIMGQVAGKPGEDIFVSDYVHRAAACFKILWENLSAVQRTLSSSFKKGAGRKR